MIYIRHGQQQDFVRIIYHDTSRFCLALCICEDFQEGSVASHLWATHKEHFAAQPTTMS